MSQKTSSKTIAYIRASTNKQDADNQKLELLDYARKHSLKIDDFIKVTVSSNRNAKQRRINELLDKVTDHDTLMATELSRLGRSTAEVIGLVNQLLAKTSG